MEGLEVLREKNDFRRGGMIGSCGQIRAEFLIEEVEHLWGMMRDLACDQVE